MKKALALLIAVLIAVQPAFAFAEDGIEQYRGGTPWPCIGLEGVMTEETPAEPEDNFALAVARDFYLNAELIPEYGSTGTVITEAVAANEDMSSLFTGDVSYDSDDAKLARALYDLQMDWEGRNAQGVQPLMDLIALLDGVSTIDELNAYFIETPLKDLLGIVFNAGATFDILDSSRVVGAIEPAGLFLDSAEYGENPTELGNIQREAYMTLVTGMLARLGYSEEKARQTAEDAFAFEALIAPAILTGDDEKQADYISRILNYYTRDEALELEGRLPAVEFAERFFGEQELWLVTMPAFLELMQEVYTDENIGMIKNWLICHAAADCATLLDRDCYDFYYETVSAMQGTAVLPDEVIASATVASLLPWETAHLYCDNFVTPEDKQMILSITDEVIATYEEILAEADFISEPTRAAAIEKLDNMIVHSLYPDDWSEYTYSGLEFLTAEEGGSYLDAVNAISEAAVLKAADELSRPKDRARWNSQEVPTTFNCTNDITANTINILAAFCRGNLYNHDMSREEILGRVGMVIAHEISHSFDRTGAQFDREGNYAFWWTEEDYAAFTERTDRLAAYYDNMTAWEGMPFKGSNMTGETCADMTAMECMLRMAEKTEDFDYDAFFRSYALLWAEKGNIYIVLSYLQNEHPVGYIRANAVLQQFDEFLDFYGITEGDGMYLAPEDRVLVW